MTTFSTVVGIDVAKHSLDVATLPESMPRTFSNDAKLTGQTAPTLLTD